MSNEELIREWVMKRQEKKLVKSFYPRAITKELNISEEEIVECCKQLVSENKLDVIYDYSCECGFYGTANKEAVIPKSCEFCDSNDLNIEMLFKFCKRTKIKNN